MVSNFVTTEDLSISLPVAGRVRITPKGTLAVAGSQFTKNFSQKSPSAGVPTAMALQQSMVLPPPTARIRSMSCFRQMSMPSYTFSVRGLGMMPVSS